MKATMPPVARMRRESGFKEGIRILDEESRCGGHGFGSADRPLPAGLDAPERTKPLTLASEGHSS